MPPPWPLASFTALKQPGNRSPPPALPITRFSTASLAANHYMRTVKLYRSPSEAVVRYALRNTWSDFLASSPLAVPLKKFLAPKLAPHYRDISDLSNLKAAA